MNQPSVGYTSEHCVERFCVVDSSTAGRFWKSIVLHGNNSLYMNLLECIYMSLKFRNVTVRRLCTSMEQLCLDVEEACALDPLYHLDLDSKFNSEVENPRTSTSIPYGILALEIARPSAQQRSVMGTL